MLFLCLGANLNTGMKYLRETMEIICCVNDKCLRETSSRLPNVNFFYVLKPASFRGFSQHFLISHDLSATITCPSAGELQFISSGLTFANKLVLVKWFTLFKSCFSVRR